MADLVARELDARAVRYAIGGALCLAYWGVVRATKDLDLNVFVADDAIEPVLDALEGAGCHVEREASHARARARGDLVAWWQTMRVDVFVSFHAFHEEVARRVVTGELPSGLTVPFLSAEDLTVFKALFARPKDLADLHRLFAARQERLDIGYVTRWLDELLGPDDPRVADVPARFARVLAHTDPAG